MIEMVIWLVVIAAFVFRALKRTGHWTNSLRGKEAERK